MKRNAARMRRRCTDRWPSTDPGPTLAPQERRVALRADAEAGRVELRLAGIVAAHAPACLLAKTREGGSHELLTRRNGREGGHFELFGNESESSHGLVLCR